MKELTERYEFEFAGGEQNVYLFTTDADIKYEVKLVPSSEYFNAYMDLGAEVFEMVISIADNPTGGRLVADERVAPTIFVILRISS